MEEQVNEAVKTSLKLALEEEAKASRRARQDLIQENELLRVQLRSSRQRQQALEAENEALKTLLQCTEVLGMPITPWSQGGASDGRASEPAAEEETVATDPESSESELTVEPSGEAVASKGKALRKAAAKRAARRQSAAEKPKVEVVRKFSFAERDFQGPNGTVGHNEHGIEKESADSLVDLGDGVVVVVVVVDRKSARCRRPKFYRTSSAMLETSMKFRLARRSSDSSVMDVIDWKTRMADLQGIMSRLAEVDPTKNRGASLLSKLRCSTSSIFTAGDPS
eukprot:symbB.v1.2.037118.t2/scaffold5393.1/size48236/6